jgi:hypothetical protein
MQLFFAVVNNKTRKKDEKKFCGCFVVVGKHSIECSPFSVEYSYIGILRKLSVNRNIIWSRKYYRADRDEKQKEKIVKIIDAPEPQNDKNLS